MEDQESRPPSMLRIYDNLLIVDFVCHPNLQNIKFVYPRYLEDQDSLPLFSTMTPKLSIIGSYLFSILKSTFTTLHDIWNILLLLFHINFSLFFLDIALQINPNSNSVSTQTRRKNLIYIQPF